MSLRDAGTLEAIAQICLAQAELIYRFGQSQDSVPWARKLHERLSRPYPGCWVVNATPMKGPNTQRVGRLLYHGYQALRPKGLTPEQGGWEREEVYYVIDLTGKAIAWTKTHHVIWLVSDLQEIFHPSQAEAIAQGEAWAQQEIAERGLLIEAS